MTSHPIQRRWFAEDLIRLRRADDERRFIASQRIGRIDPNPHQVEAVIFALQRIPQGGCILADEVGLGKTIEAGLVMAQLRAEGAERILLITPKPLLGQWRQELSTLFGLDAIEGQEREEGFEGPGVFGVGREYAGSERGMESLLASGRWDLAIIDEAHEMFAGIYRRFDRRGTLGSSRYAKTAARVKTVLADTPVLLLTATPIQNTLTELWGLVQYVEPTGTLLGDLPTFRSLFCEGDDRRLRPGQDEELRRRIATVCQRTLRRQAQEFMQRKFVRRTTRLFEYDMSPDEQSLYDDVTAYLLDPNIFAFDGGSRRLLLLSFHRRMGSSIRALAESLGTVADRLARRLTGKDDATAKLFADDLEEDPSPAPEEREDEVADRTSAELEAAGPSGPRRLEDELKHVHALAERARSLPTDGKAQQAIAALRLVLDRGERGEGSGKVVVFTEAISTQEYLREVFIASGLVDDQAITLFRGDNAGARAQQALAQWMADVGDKMPEAARPSPSIAVRLALVHEFLTKSKVFISTEAGAKGLNLQFCDTILNYDLPWNPQRIEQRIGRCHRYGQTRDVTVINFLARGNEAQRLTFEILSRKLELFGTVLDASDAVLHESTVDNPGAFAGALAGDFEAMLADAYAKARSPAELAAALARMSEQVGNAKTELEQTHARTAGLIESRFDETVRSAFATLSEAIPEGLAVHDQELEAVVTRYFEATGVAYQRAAEGTAVTLVVEPSPAWPIEVQTGARLLVGRLLENGQADTFEPLHVGHRLIRAAIDEARRCSQGSFVVRMDGPPALHGCRGRLVVCKIHYAGYEPTVSLLPVAVLEGGDGGPQAFADAVQLFAGDVVDIAPEALAITIDDADMDDAIEEALFLAQGAVEAREQLRFEEAMERIERYMDDRVMVIVRAQKELQERLADAQRRRDAASGSDARGRVELECRELQEEIESTETEIARLRRRDDAEYHNWSGRAYERRYAAPRRERIIEARFEIHSGGGA